MQLNETIIQCVLPKELKLGNDYVSFFSTTSFQVAWKRNFLCVKNYQDLIKLRQEKFLTCLDKILSRSYQGVPRNVWLSRSWQDVSSIARVNKILHVMGRCIKFRFTGLTLLNRCLENGGKQWSGVQKN